jgi:hypothetical protein
MKWRNRKVNGALRHVTRKLYSFSPRAKRVDRERGVCADVLQLGFNQSLRGDFGISQ